jgi:GNAT superfamily N-acetyltransferase
MTTVSIKRLGPGDEDVLELLARDDADFGLDDPEALPRPVDPAAARRYLANPAVLCWVAVDGDAILGHLQCVVVPLRSGAGQELLLNEIGVRAAWRERGVGRALLGQMDAWMRTNDVTDVWLLADNEIAVDFYRACGFATEDPPPVYMLRTPRVRDRGA